MPRNAAAPSATTDRIPSTVKLERLLGVKSRYDPDNFFRLNQNIPSS